MTKSNLPEDIARAAELVKELYHIRLAEHNVIGAAFIQKPQVQLTEDAWMKHFGQQDGDHVVEISRGNIFFNFVEDGVTFTAVRLAKKEDENE